MTPHATSAWSITRVGREAQPLLDNLKQLYIHDMAEWFGNDVMPDGRYVYDTDHWWEPPYTVYLATADSVPAGFAVIGSAQEWTGDEAGRDVNAFFVLRKYRRAGAGARLAAFLWSQHPGEWLVRVAATNTPGVPFWRKTVNACVDARYQEQQPLIRERHWHFFRFNSGIEGA